jgi:hypothetical protein
MKLLIMQSSPASHHFLPLRFKYSIQNPFKTTGKIIVLYILIFKFLREEMGRQKNSEVNSRQGVVL